MNKAYLLSLAFACITSVAMAQDAQVLCTESRYVFDNNTNDITPAGHHLSPYGNFSYGDDRFGRHNKAAYFDGQSYLQSQNVRTEDWHSMSYSCWVKPHSDHHSRSSLMSINGSTVWLNAFSRGKVCASMDGYINTKNSSHECDKVVVTEKWVHVVTVNNGTTTKIYINGVLEKEYPETLYNSPSGPFVLGGIENGTELYKGWMDDVNIFKCALTPQEVQALYDTEVLAVGDEVNPVADFKLFPNPGTGDAVVLETEQLTTNSELNVIDATGRIVDQMIITAGSRQNTLNISAYPAGIYMVQLKTSEGIRTHKLMVE